ncbi:MAG: trypsin-like peptidase domain-containing protein, partial [Planctomycetota bacterium]|nr:trypsin-like peptidase domain-containing protein [Planctomycetota bacterium]
SVAAKLEPSVVHITSLQRPTVVDFWGRPVGRRALQPTGLGSGSIISKDGYIVTNYHVIKGAEKLRVRLTDGREFDAKVVGRPNSVVDVAVLRIEADNLTPAEFADSDQVSVGEWVMAIGSPFGYSNSVTAGIVSATGRTGVGLTGYEDFIQTDASINPGNSGGPLVNLEGKIVGMNTAIATRAGGSEGVGFATPANLVRDMVDRIINKGPIKRGWLGADLLDSDQGVVRRNAQRGINAPGMRPGRVMIDSVVPGGPAARAGLQKGDVIVSFRGVPIDSVTRLKTAISLAKPGVTVPLQIERDRKPQTLNVELGDYAAGLGDTASAIVVEPIEVAVQDVAPSEMKELGLEKMRGVRVVDVIRAGRADAAGVEPGDIITAVNGKPTPTSDAFDKELSRADFVRGVRLSVVRGEERGRIDIVDESNGDADQ